MLSQRRSPSCCRPRRSPALRRSEAVRSGDILVPVRHVNPQRQECRCSLCCRPRRSPHTPPKRSGKERGHSCPRSARPPSATGMSLLLMLPPEAEPLTLPPRRSSKERGHSCPRSARPPQRQECRCSLCCRQRRSRSRFRRGEAVRSGDIPVPVRHVNPQRQECRCSLCCRQRRSRSCSRRSEAPALRRSEAVRSGDILVPVRHVPHSDRNVAAPYAVARGEAPRAPPKRSPRAPAEAKPPRSAEAKR